jgi:hypothetical protein
VSNLITLLYTYKSTIVAHSYNITKCSENKVEKRLMKQEVLDENFYLSSNYIIIFDRWYYANMINSQKLNNKNISYMFRMKMDLQLMTQNMDFMIRFKILCNSYDTLYHKKFIQ